MSAVIRAASVRLTMAVLMMGLLVACSKKDESAPAADSAATSSAQQAAQTASSQTNDKLKAMTPEALRQAALTALGENRIYAPAGDNAVDYYLALHEKMPRDPGVVSALTDLSPYLVSAVEQSIYRENIPEAQRLVIMLERADARAPALPRLKQSISAKETLIASRSEAEKARAEAAAKAAGTPEQQRLQEEQQRVAAQQQTEATASAAVKRAAEIERAAASKREADQRAAAERAPGETATTSTTSASPPPIQISRPTLKVVSAPAPQYPPEALRARTSGEVIVEITVGTSGAVESARVVNSTSARTFDRAALNAVRRWKFEPISTPTTTRRTIAFSPGT